MTLADKLVERWVNDLTPCDDLDAWAKEIDPRVRIEGYLHTTRKRFVFSDTSQAIFAGNCLSATK